VRYPVIANASVVWRRRYARRRREGRKRFFLKKEAKTFCSLARVLRQRQHLIIKSFLVLFFKKERLPFFPFAVSPQ
jgi:hypothetical protein